MKKALFVDHAFHRKTRSADFFIEIVKQGFEVEVYYLTPEEEPDTGILAAAADADVVLLWQMDFLAPLFLAMGKPTIVIPMYDGSAGMPDIHWIFAGGARFVNFSLRLNERIRMLGGDTMLVRYFPPPVAESELPRFDQLGAFFWQRRPDHGIDFNYISALIGSELDSFHLHNAPDIDGSFRVSVPSDASYQFTESSWFKDRGDYQACLASANIFVAPRVAEGIGMALLEAMSRGMLVLAHDAPTNNEYVSNGLNGVLFNKDLPAVPVYFRGDAARMGRLAWKTVVDGHKKWLASHSDILAWIDGAKSRPPIEMDFTSFYRDLWHSYYGSMSEYELFLRRHLGFLEQLSTDPTNQFLDLIGGCSDQSGMSVPRECWLDENGFLDVTIPDNRFIGSGWSSAEAKWRWAIGTSSDLYFSSPRSSSKRVRARFFARSLRQLGKWTHCSIALNGQPVFSGPITPGWKEYEFSFEGVLLKEENQLHLVFDKAMSIPADDRKMSVCFKSFRFSDDHGVDSMSDECVGKVGVASESHLPRAWRRLLDRV